MAWTEDKKAEVIAKYVDTMENEYETDAERSAASVEVVKELAGEFDETVNGVRQVLSAAKVYIKKAPAAAASASGTSKRINKAEAQQELKNLIASINPEAVENDIIDKLTGKAAQYFTGVIQQAI